MAWSHTNVSAGGELIATYDPNGLHFFLNDWLGSRRVQTDYQGIVEQTCTNLPYGDGETCQPDPSGYLFAGLERDSEAGLENAMYRQYSSAFGRWTTPDPYSRSYDRSDPQSLNRYAYVSGSPFSATDQSGQYPCTPMPGVDFCTETAEKAASSISIAWLANDAPFVGFAVDLGMGIYELGKVLGLWGGHPVFNGNAAASQSGKNVPNSANQSNCPQKYQNFFSNMNIYRKLAAHLDTKVIFLLAQSSIESGWLGSHDAALHNLFGMTHAGKSNINFPSYQASADAYYNSYNEYVGGTHTINDFTSGLQQVPPHGYNTVNPNYYQQLNDQQKTVSKWAQNCGVDIQ
jgi:RHS repeat-associated protein